MAEQLPLFPLNTVLFPGMPLPLHIFEERYRRLLRIRSAEEVLFGVILIQSGEPETGPVEVQPVGTAARLVTQRTLPDGRADILISGTRRFRVHSVNWSAGYGIADVSYLEDLIGDVETARQLLGAVARKFGRYVEGITQITGRQFSGIAISDDPAEASYDLITRLPLHTWERQRLLELSTVVDRLRAVTELVDREVTLLFQAGAAGLVLNHPGGRFSAN